MRRPTRLLISFAIVGLAIFAFWLFEQVKIDSCLDRGGRWNYDGKACEGATDR
jgi:hypothetical protein